MTGLTGLFKAEPVESVDNEKLVDLFRNRAELKKEFAALRNEKYQLQDRLKQQEGATARVQQKMDHLESLLLDPEWVFNVVAFYQLRRLAAHCHSRLGRLAEELKQQHEQRKYQKAFDEWSASRDRQVAAVSTDLSAAEERIEEFEAQLLEERERLSSASGFIKMFRGRSLEARVSDVADELQTMQMKQSALLDELEKIRNVSPPAQEGLDVATKRSINFMILSFAQQLFIHFEEDELAVMAKEASEKSVGAINYGSKMDCDEIVERVEERWSQMKSPTEYADVMQKRARLIADNASFREEEDAVPIAATAATLFCIDQNGRVSKRDANLLGENYFGIAKVLSR